MKYEVNKVFTPRSHDVNDEMYIHREENEKQLLRAINGSLHAILFGESGNGKSWLYKKIFRDKKINYTIANCANAARFNSITEEIYGSIIEAGKYLKDSYSQEVGAEANAVVVKGSTKINQHYVKIEPEKIEQSFHLLSKRARKGKMSVIVLDNLERILKKKILLEELANIIILLDDPRYAKYHIKILLVGVPSDIVSYFTSSDNSNTVGNRIQELDKISSLDEKDVLKFTEKGFNTQLKLGLSNTDIANIASHVYSITLGIAQRVQEYCEILAYKIEDNKFVYKRALLSESDLQWIKVGLRQSYSVIEKYLNSKETKIARRNQVLFCLGLLKAYDFTPNKIKDLIYREFEETTIGIKTLNINSILNVFTEEPNPILRRKEHSNIYEVIDPRYIMTIRIMLFKNRSLGKVEKKKFLI